MKTETNAKTARTLDSELKAIFEIEQGGRKQTLMVRKDRMVIGTVESADVKLVGSKVAPVQAFVEIKYGASEKECSAQIIDLASPTGVSINGKKVINEVLRSGDLVQVGDALFKFSFAKPEFQKPLPDRALLLIDENEVKTIFDYRPPIKEALEVVYSWHSVILDVKHFVGQSSVSLGGTHAEDFLVPSVYSQGSQHQLAVRNGKDWTVFIEEKMTGILYLNGQLHSIDEYRREKSGGNSPVRVNLAENDFIKIEAGGIAFYLSQTVAPPVMRNQGNLVGDPFLAKTMLGSLALMACALIFVLFIYVPPVVEQPVPEVMATILYHPEKYSIKHRLPEPEKHEAPKEAATPAPKKAEVDFTKPKEKEGKVAKVKSSQPGKKQSGQNQAKEGAGARAKGAEGSRGAKNAQTSSTKQTAANRPSPQAGVGRGGTTSQTADNGNVQMLKGATNKILDLLGGSGQKLGNSGSKLQGFGGFSTQGNGGLALAGQGKGGGGNADTLLGGTSDHGRGGGKVGTGLGAEGTGAGIVGGKTRVELNVGGGDETVVVGAIDRDAIEAAIRAHRDEFRFCYEREVNAGHPNLAGKIVTAFVIGGSGRASQLAIASSSMAAPSVERCVLQVLTRIQFPQPAGGVPVTIKYPFGFTNASK